MEPAPPGPVEKQRRTLRRRLWAALCFALVGYGLACAVFGNALVLERALSRNPLAERWVTGVEAVGAGVRYVCFGSALFLVKGVETVVGRGAQAARAGGVADLVLVGFLTFVLL